MLIRLICVEFYLVINTIIIDKTSLKLVEFIELGVNSIEKLIIDKLLTEKIFGLQYNKKIFK